ncbi:MAG TPA: hypothetical protein VK718_11520 [Ferruginibacter sp.]|jgi:hypothetical protein|nr:hypothetical protein [Ferruginibacter sp.]
MSNKINYYYIDESGAIDNDSSIFILGCIKTEDPKTLQEELNKIIRDINESIYFDQETKDEIREHGFHAVDNHPDVRAKFYSVLPLLNFRSYFIIINKKDTYFKKLAEKYSSDLIYKICISNLLSDRLKKGKAEKNILYFEELTFKDSSLNKIITEFLKEFINIDIEYHIVNKLEMNLSLIDYINYIFYSILNDTTKKQTRMNQNFELIRPKIGSIKYLNQKKYFSRHKEYNLTDIIKTYDGCTKG